MNWLLNNKEWVFSGVGVAIAATIATVIGWVFRSRQERSPSKPESERISITNQNVLTIGTQLGDGNANIAPNVDRADEESLDVLKAKTYVLFIDDDTKFKVVDILVKSGWVHTRRISDVPTLDDEKLQQAHILFIDVQGVGKKLQFKAEGLGLASAVRDKYPRKKIVIYSAETRGERFHEGLRKADDFLAKDSDPYQFQEVTERLARELQAEP
jgi:hypothetical protein